MSALDHHRSIFEELHRSTVRVFSPVGCILSLYTSRPRHSARKPSTPALHYRAITLLCQRQTHCGSKSFFTLVLIRPSCALLFENIQGDNNEHKPRSYNGNSTSQILPWSIVEQGASGEIKTLILHPCAFTTYLQLPGLARQPRAQALYLRNRTPQQFQKPPAYQRTSGLL